MGCFFSRALDEASITYDMTPILHLPVIFVNGVPGAGNQTVSCTIAAMTGYAMIRPGDLLREEALKDTERGRLVAECISLQEEIPAQLTLDLIKESMLEQASAHGYIIVGFPRSARLARLFRRQIKRPDKIVALHIDDEVAASRLQSKLSELGRPESEINAARDVVREAAYKVKRARRRFGSHVISLDSTDNQKTIVSHLREVLSDTIDKFQSNTPSPSVTTSARAVAPQQAVKEPVQSQLLDLIL